MNEIPEPRTQVLIDRHPVICTNTIFEVDGINQHNIIVGIYPIHLKIRFSRNYFTLGFSVFKLGIEIGGRIG